MIPPDIAIGAALIVSVAVAAVDALVREWLGRRHG